MPNVAATLALVISLGGTAYAASTLAPNSVDTQAIQNQAVTGPKLAVNAVNGSRVANDSLTATDIAPGAIGGSELAANSVDGSKVVDNSIGLADLVGANVSGSISFSIGANTCSTLNFGVSGAAVGQVVLMSYTGTVAVPPGVVFGPFKVVSAGNVSVRACNVTASAASVSSIGVRFVTFG